jgi:hypothetical protein
VALLLRLVQAIPSFERGFERVPQLQRKNFCTGSEFANDEMPKSKRSKVVSLTKTEKKTREWKESLFSKIREAIDAYDFVPRFMNAAET